MNEYHLIFITSCSISIVFLFWYFIIWRGIEIFKFDSWLTLRQWIFLRWEWKLDYECVSMYFFFLFIRTFKKSSFNIISLFWYFVIKIKRLKDWHNIFMKIVVKDRIKCVCIRITMLLHFLLFLHSYILLFIKLKLRFLDLLVY